MFPYPITLPWPRKNRIKHIPPNFAREYHKQIEDYLNMVAKDTPPPGKSLTYPEIAVACGVDKQDVRIFVYPLSGSTGGITVGNPELESGTRKGG